MSRDGKEPLIPHIRPSTKNRIRKYLYATLIIIAIFLLYRSINKDAGGISTMGRSGDPIYGKNTVIVARPSMKTALDRIFGRTPVKFVRVSQRRVMTIDAPKPKLDVPEPKPVKIDIYMESQCPDTSRFLRQQLKKTWDLLGTSTRIELSIVPFGKARCLEKGNDFECQCQHGGVECEINQLMNCVIDRVGFPHKYIEMVMCMQGKYSIDEAMKCVQGGLPAEVNRMRECATGPRGRRLLALSGQKTAALKPAIDFIPWIVIDGARNSDALYDLSQNVCEAMKPMNEKCKEYLASLN